MNIIIDIKGQVLARADNNEIVADSKNYVFMKFNFLNPDWDNVNKFALFSAFNELGDINKKVLIEDNKCLVPEDILKRGTFDMTIIGVDDKGDIDPNNDVLITSTKITFNVAPSGYIEFSDDSTILNGNRTEEEDPKWQEILSSLE